MFKSNTKKKIAMIPTLELDPSKINGMLVPELRERLQAAGRPSTGVKVDLVRRLQEYIDECKFGELGNEWSEEATTKEPEVTAPPAEPEPVVETVIEPVADDAAPEQTEVFSFTVSSSNDAQIAAAASFAHATSADSEKSAAEKIAERSARFGSTISEEQKRKLREFKFGGNPKASDNRNNKSNEKGEGNNNSKESKKSKMIAAPVDEEARRKRMERFGIQEVQAKVDNKEDKKRPADPKLIELDEKKRQRMLRFGLATQSAENSTSAAEGANDTNVNCVDVHTDGNNATEVSDANINESIEVAMEA